MRVESILISDITVGERRREEYGDIEGLAESINRYQLLQPIVVDGDNNLIAGERRLRACRDVLGWLEIPARLFSELTEDERHEIELEENVRRKDLTPFELSKNIVALKETAAEILRGELMPTMGINSETGPGRPEKPDSAQKVAERIGISRQTIERAEQHVEAVTRYPELSVVPTQKGALDAAKALDEMPERERNHARSQLITEGKRAVAEITGRKPAHKPKTQGAKYRDNLSQIQVFISSIRSVGAEELTAAWTEAERHAFLVELRECHSDIGSLVSELDEAERELQRKVG